MAFYMVRDCGAQALDETALFCKDLGARFLSFEARQIPHHSIKILGACDDRVSSVSLRLSQILKKEMSEFLLSI